MVRGPCRPIEHQLVKTPAYRSESETGGLTECEPPAHSFRPGSGTYAQ